MPNAPLFAGDPSIAKRWISGSPTVLWLGDSLGTALESHIFQAFPVTPAGMGVRGGDASAMGAAQAFQTTSAAGGLATGALPSGLKNYSTCFTWESVFNGVAIGASGAQVGIANRINADTTAGLLLGTRTGVQFNALDWLAGQAGLTLRNIMYRDANGVSAGLFRNYALGSNSNLVLKATGGFNSTNGATGYVTEDLALAAPASAEDIYLEAQAPTAGCAPSAGTHFTNCYSIIRTNLPGFTFLPMSVGGWTAANFNDTTRISAAAWAGMLPLLGTITDVVFSATQNGNAVASDFTTFVSTIRAILPNVPFIFLPTFWCYNNRLDGGATQTNVNNCYTAFQSTPNSAFWNLFAAAGDPTQNNTLGYFGDGVHPSTIGKMFFLKTLWGIIQQHGATRSTAVGGRRFPQIAV